MANRIRTSSEIDEQIKKLLALKEKALEHENITKYTNTTLNRMKEILEHHGCSFSEEGSNA